MCNLVYSILSTCRGAKIYLSLFFSQENSIFTHLTAQEKIALLRLAKMKEGSVFVEIGSYVGASSCFIAAGALKGRRGRLLYCVDTWKNDAMTEGHKDTYDSFIENTKKYKDIIVPLKGTSAEVSPRFDGKIDFLFIDGDHTYEGVKLDVESWFPKLKPGALVVFHDIGWAEGIQRVVKEKVAPLAKKEGRLPNLYWAWL